MPRKKYLSLLTVILVLLQYFSPLVGLIPVQATGKSNVCPDEKDGWTQHYSPGEDGNVDYTAPTGYVVDSVCIKGGSEGRSHNGYTKIFTEDTWYKKDGKKCVGTEGIGTQSASAIRSSKAKGKKCAEISHASFKLARVQGEELVCTPGVNLLKNPDFETPVVMNASNWDIFPDGTAGLDWKVEWHSTDTLFEGQNRPDIANLELHKGVNGWLPQNGAQYAELDADWFGPSNPLNNEPTSVKISQEIATIPGFEYKIDYHFSPRPGTPEADNKLVSSWAGNVLDTHIATGVGNTSWTKYTKTVEATSSSAVLAFMDDGTPNSLGTFIDNVSVECVGEVKQVVEPLILTSMCWEGDNVHRFRVRNSNEFGVDYEISRPVQWTDGGTAPSGDSYFKVAGTKGEATTTKIRWQNENEEWKETVKAANNNYCEGYDPSLMKASLHIKKYECTEGSVLNKTSFTTGEIELNENQIRPDSSGLVNGIEFDQLDGESFDGCVEGENYTFEVDQHPEDTAGGGSPTGTVVPLENVVTNADGDGMLTEIEYEGRLEVREFENDPSRILGFACYRNGEGHGDISNYGEYALFNENRDAFCIAFNKPEERFADVTVCKQDEQRNGLPGWNVQLLGEKVDSMEVLPDDLIGGSITPVLSTELTKDDYVLLASGAYDYRGGTSLKSDAGYSERLESDGLVGPYAPWINVFSFDPPYQGTLGITVNGAPTDWGYYSPIHNYAKGYTDFEGKFSFTSLDDNTSDNSGSMNVDIYKGYAGLTGQNGCVTFEDVPYGEYTTDEILMQDWENVRGKGSEVVVDNETETFTLVNRPVSEPAKLLATKVICSEEKYLPNNQQGAIDADTASEWVAQSQGQCQIVEDWDFQWGPSGSGSYGAFQTETDEKGDPWTTFSAGTMVELPDIESVGGRVELREVFPDESYVPFSNDGNVSAELYCTGDTANYDNWEWLSNYQEDNTYYCVAFNAPRMGTIEGMKYEDANANGHMDDNENGLEDWQIVIKPETLEPLQELQVSANNMSGVNSSVLTNNRVYLVETSGVWDNANGRDDVDAEYWSRDGWSTIGDFENNPSYDPREIDLVINNQNIFWGAYNSDHLYKTVLMGEGGSVNFRIYDYNLDESIAWYGDNVGSLTVKIYDVTDYVVETDEDGEYTKEVENGEYQVVEINQLGWIQTAPGPSYCHLTVENGSTETCNFGNTRMGSIDGYKLEDTNGDGVLTRQDARLKGWEINLWNGDENGPIDKINTKTTDENGYYKFDNLLPGIYWLNENQKEGWTQTAGPVLRGPLYIEVGTDLHGNNFGNFELGSVAGYKWKDMNGNGQGDESKESLLEGWKITLEKLYDNPELKPAVNMALPVEETDENGVYKFEGLFPGMYKICEEMEDGWMQTYPSGMNESNEDFEGDDVNCHYITIDTSGQTLVNYNFGNFQLGQVSGYKWDDDNGNGIKTYGEPKMANWTVELRKDSVDSDVLATDITDSEGNFKFDDLEPGTYYIKEVNKNVVNGSWIQTYPVDPNYHTFVIDESGQILENMNFGNNLIADILAEKVAVSDNFTPGGLVEFEIEITNKGTETAHGVEVWDNIPEGFQYYDSNPNGQYTESNRRVTWTIESLDVNEVWNATIRILVPANSEATTLTNEVRGLRSCQLVNEFSATLTPVEQEVEEPVIEFCEDDPTPDDNVDTATVSRASVAGLTDTKQETDGRIKGLATTSLGKVLGASNNLSETGRNIVTSIVIGFGLIATLVVLNFYKTKKQYR